MSTNATATNTYTDPARLAALAEETRNGRLAGVLDAKSDTFDPQSNPWLPARNSWDRAKARAWADGYTAGYLSPVYSVCFTHRDPWGNLRTRFADVRGVSESEIPAEVTRLYGAVVVISIIEHD